MTKADGKSHPPLCHSIAFRLLGESGRDVGEHLAKSLGNAACSGVDFLGILGSLLVVLVVGSADRGDFLLPAVNVDLEDFLEVLFDNLELAGVVVKVDILELRQVADGGLLSGDLAVDALADPLEDAAVVAEARPHEAAVVALAEPVHEVDLRELGRIGGGALHLEPVLEVVGNVVAEERKHRHRVATDLTDLVGDDGCCDFGTGGRTHEHAMRPALGLVHQRNRGRTATTEEDRVDRHSGRLLVVHSLETSLVEHRAVDRRSREAAVLVGGDISGSLDFSLGHARLRTHAVRIVLADVAGIALPVDAFLRSLDAHIFPPDVAIGRENDVREDRILLAALEGVGVGVHRRARSNAEEAVLGVDGVETAISARLEPRDVVTDRLELPALELGKHHGEVRRAAGGRERSRDVILLLLRRGEREDEHVLGHPALILRHLGGDAESEALLAEERVAAIARTEGPDLAIVGELRDVLVLDLLRARPSDILLTLLERSAHGVDAGDELTVGAELLKDSIARAGHDVHVDDNVRGVGDLDAVLGDRVADRTHRIRNHVHRAALHAALVRSFHLLLHFDRIHPVVGGACVDLALGADERAAFNARDVALVRTGEVASGTLLVVQLDELAVLDHHLADVDMLFLRALHDDDLVGRAELVPLVNPRENLRIGEFWRLGHVLFSPCSFGA